MTTQTVAARTGQLAVRRPPPPDPMGGLLVGRLRVIAGQSPWPSKRWQRDPVAFAEEVLGVKLWAKQVEILEAVRDAALGTGPNKVAIRSGHKVSKSFTFAIIALWFFCSFEDARVVMTSVTSRQVDAVLWRELRKLRVKAKRPIDGDMHELARSGFRATDLREVVGFTAREAEAVAGVSGARILYLADESSGIADPIFDAIEGNMAGGAVLVMASNPTRAVGKFFRAFHKERESYRCIAISSEESPNVVAGRAVFPGLATRGWIEDRRREWGEDSALYKVRVKGEFVLAEEGKILPLHLIGEAEQRWADTPEEGRLQLGLDPAGPGGDGDESVFAVRRGKKILALYPFRGLSDEAHVVHAVSILREHRKGAPEEIPLVVVDREGPVGKAVYGSLWAYSQQHQTEFELIAVRASDQARREPDTFAHTRDELWRNLELWVRDGGAIPEDTKLANELHAPEWRTLVTGKTKASSKDELRKILGHSPDRADACALAVWRIAAWAAGQPMEGRVRAPVDIYDSPREMDAYAMDAVPEKDPVYG